jgi:hypothetical protein
VRCNRSCKVNPTQPTIKVLGAYSITLVAQF